MPKDGLTPLLDYSKQPISVGNAGFLFDANEKVLDRTLVGVSIQLRIAEALELRPLLERLDAVPVKFQVSVQERYWAKFREVVAGFGKTSPTLYSARILDERDNGIFLVQASSVEDAFYLGREWQEAISEGGSAQ